MRGMLLGLVMVVGAGAVRGEVAFYNTSTTGLNKNNNGQFFVTFSASNTSPSITGFKLFSTDNVSGTKLRVDFFIDTNPSASTKQVISSAYDGTGFYFDLTGAWTGGGGTTNLPSASYGLNLSNFSVYEGTGSALYDSTTNATVTTNPGFGLTGTGYLGHQARFEVSAVAVPEPGTLLLGGIAAACGGGGVWWRRKRKAAPVADEAVAVE